MTRRKTTGVTGRNALLLAATIGVLSPMARAATIGFDRTTAGPHDYNDAGNWVGGNINGIWDASLDIPASQTVTFGADTVLTTGLSFNYTGGGNLTMRSAGGPFTLQLGGDVLVNTASNRTITFGGSGSSALNVDLGGATRSFDVASGRTLGFVNVISNGGIVASGGTLNFSGANTYAGNTVVNAGNFSLNGSAGSSANSDFTVGVASVTFKGDGGSGITRAKSVTLNGAGSSNGSILSISGNATNNTTESITNALNASAGYSLVSISPNAARNITLSAGSYTRAAGSTTLFRGTNLGLNTLASKTAGAANVQLGAVTLSGGGGPAGSSTIGIIKGAYGDVVSGGNGSGLVTYDTANGVRLLNTATEYTAAIANGQTALDNVRYVRTSGGASQDINLTAATTTINSLSFDITGAGTDSGVTISGDAGTTLTLASGAIFARQAVTTANSTDAMVVSVPTLDLNGGEGVFLAFTNGFNQGNTPAPLRINSSIANDGGNGVTVGGTGQVVFGGDTAHSYTGVTTLNSGVLRLDNSIDNAGIPGDLVMNGGSLLKSQDAIPDTASITVNGGNFYMDATFSSGNNGHSETLNNFTLNGGSFTNHGSNADLNVNGDLTVNGSTMQMNQGGDLIVLGNTSVNGGLLVARESTSTSTANALTTLNTLSITNTASGPYTAVTLNGHTSNKGALLTLSGDVSFTGNATNANTVLISSSNLALANQGVIALEGTRTFTIGNGAAADDLTIEPAIGNGSSTGALTKAGAGTLRLNGVSSYTGATTITGGTLALGVAGSIASSPTIAIAAGATFDTTAQSLAMLGSQTFVFNVNGAGAGSAGLLDAAALDISAGVVDFSTTGLLDDAAYVLANYTSLTGSAFAAVTNLPAGYTIDYDYGNTGDTIAIVSAVAVPEPTTLGVLAVVGLGMLARRRGR